MAEEGADVKRGGGGEVKRVYERVRRGKFNISIIDKKNFFIF